MGAELGDFYLVFLKLSYVMWKFGVWILELHCGACTCASGLVVFNFLFCLKWLGLLVGTWGGVVGQDAKYPHWICFAPFVGPDSVALWKIVRFCRKIWFFDYRSFLNRKEIVVSLTLQSMPMVNTMFHAWEIRILNLLNRSETKNKFKQNWNVKNMTCSFCWIKEHVELCCVFLCRTM